MFVFSNEAFHIRELFLMQKYGKNFKKTTDMAIYR